MKIHVGVVLIIISVVWDVVEAQNTFRPTLAPLPTLVPRPTLVTLPPLVPRPMPDPRPTLTPLPNVTVTLLPNVTVTTLPTLPPLSGTFNESDKVDEIFDHVHNSLIFQELQLNNITLPPFTFQVGNLSISVQNRRIKNLANIQRTGDVLITYNIFTASLSSAFSIIDVSSTEDISVQAPPNISYPNGNVYLYSQNVTVFTVFTLTYATQTVTLSGFELSVGDVVVSVTGLGPQLEQDSTTLTRIIRETKGPFLEVFNVAFPIAFNVAAAAIRAALIAG